jgi:membrane protease YdiL (CAAX protease family)
VSVRERSWSPWLAVPLALAAVVAGVIAFAVAGLVRDALVAPPTHVDGLTGVAAHGTPPALGIASTLVQDLALAAGVLVVVRIASGGVLRAGALGLRGARVGSSVGYVVVGYVAFLAVSAAWTSALSIGDRENIPVQLGTRDSALALIGSGLLVGAVAPIAEELFFRGFLFGALRRYGFPLAALVSGLAFGGAHVASAPVGYLLPLAVLGVILCAIYERTGSLYPCMALHCVNNSVAFGVGDGRGWLVGACLLASGAAIVATLRGTRRLLA